MTRKNCAPQRLRDRPPGRARQRTPDTQERTDLMKTSIGPAAGSSPTSKSRRPRRSARRTPMTAGTGPTASPASPPPGETGSAGAHGADSAPQRHTTTFAAKPDQVGEARRFLARILNGCLAAADAILVLSELASNCVVHSASAERSGTFTVTAEIQDGEYVRIEA